MTTEERLKKMETKLRRTNMLLLAVALVAGMLLVAGAMPEMEMPEDDDLEVDGVVRARGFELVDENGKTRSYLGATEVSTALVFYDKNRQSRIHLTQMIPEGGAPVLHFRDEEGQTIWRAP